VVTLAARTLLDHLIAAVIPNFSFFDHAYAQEMAAIDDTKFALSKAANRLIEEA